MVPNRHIVLTLFDAERQFYAVIGIAEREHVRTVWITVEVAPEFACLHRGSIELRLEVGTGPAIE